jgi:hypothetical protein
VDAVAQAALLADLGEQPARAAARQNRRGDALWPAVGIALGWGVVRQTDVDLVRVVLLVVVAARGRAGGGQPCRRARWRATSADSGSTDG